MKIVSVNSSNGDILFEQEGLMCLNLSALVGKKLDENAISTKIMGMSITSNSINLCNLASLCYKLKIKYDSFECLELVEFLTYKIKYYQDNLTFCQNNISNKLEQDLRPFNKIYEIDNNNGIIYINKIFKEKLNYIGFADSQLITLITTVKNLQEYIPQDLLVNIPIENDSTNITYEYIKEMLI